MSKTLFDIQDSMLALLECGIDDETGEVVQTQEEFDALYESIQLDLTTKLDNTNGLAKMLSGEVDLIDAELKRLTSLKKQKVSRIEWLKRRVDCVLRNQFTDEFGNLDFEGLNKYKLTLPHSSISYRKSETVEIDEEAKVPRKFIKRTIKEEPMKAELKKYYKEGGKPIKGITIQAKLGLTIK